MTPPKLNDQYVYVFNQLMISWRFMNIHNNPHRLAKINTRLTFRLVRSQPGIYCTSQPLGGSAAVVHYYCGSLMQ